MKTQNPKKNRNLLRKKPIKKKENLRLLLWISTWIFGFIFLTLIPLLGSLYISFTEWKIVSAPKWVGLENYLGLLTDEVLTLFIRL